MDAAYNPQVDKKKYKITLITAFKSWFRNLVIVVIAVWLRFD